MLWQETGIAPIGTDIHNAKWAQSDCRQAQRGSENLTSTFPMRAIDGDNVGDAVPFVVSLSPVPVGWNFSL
jgi:hypothetical protein